MQIRNFKKEDYEIVRDVCFYTANGKNYKKNKELVCTLFCDYYLTYEPQNCFVLTAQNDKPVGYILCSENYEKYIKIFMNVYFKKIKKLSRYDAFLKKCEKWYYKKIINEYPAHLHIDILSNYQGKGFGKGLVRKLLDHLKTNGVKGIHLTVSSNNKRGIKFYYKLGFKKIKNIFGQAYILAKKL